MPTRVDTLFVELDARTSGFEQKLAESKKTLNDFGSFVTGKTGLFAASVGVALVGIGIKATQMAADYDTAIRRMRAASPQLAAGIAQLTKEINALGSASAQSRAQLIAAAEEMSQTGVASAEDAALRLRRSTELADASGANLIEVVRGLDLVADAFGQTSEDAANSLAQIFASTRGKVPFEDVLRVMERGASVLASFKVRADETGEAIGALLDAGVANRQAGTVLIGLLEKAESISKKTTAATKEEKDALEAVQRTFNAASIGANGFTNSLIALAKAVNGNAAALQLAGFSAQEANAILRVSGTTSDQVVSKAEKLAAAYRAVREAAVENRGSVTALNQELHNNLDATLTRLGNVTLPLFLSGLRLIVDLLDSTGAQARAASAALDAFATKRIDVEGLKKVPRFTAPLPFALTDTPEIIGQIAQIQNAFEKAGTAAFEGFGVREMGLIASNFQALKDAGVGAGEAFDKTYTGVIQHLKNLIITEGKAKEGVEADRKAREATGKAEQDRLTRQIKLVSDADKIERQRVAFQEKLEGLTAKQAGALSQLLERANDLRAEAVRLGKEGVISLDEWGDAIKRVDDALGVGIIETIKDVDSQTRKLAASITSTLVDDTAIAIEAMATDLRAKIRDAFQLDPSARDEQLARVDAWEAEQQNVIKVVKASEDYAKAIEVIQKRAEDRGRTETEDLADIEKLYKDVLALLNQLIPGTEAYAKAQALLRDIEKDRKGLQAGIENVFAIPQQSASETAKHFTEIALTIQNIVQGTIAFAEALGGADQKAVKLLGTLGSIAGSVAGLFSGDPKTQISSGFNLIAQLFSLGKQVAGAKSPEQREREKAVTENTKALRDLIKSNGDIIKLRVSGSDIALTRNALATLLPQLPAAGDFRRFGKDQLRNIDPARILEGFGVPFERIKEIAKSFGITLDGTIGSWRKLLEALQSLDTKGYADNFAGQLERLEDRWRVFGVTDPIQQLVDRIGLLSESSDAFKEAFAGIDLTTAEGIEQAKKKLQELFEAFGAGTITLEQFGDLTREDFRNAILTLIASFADLETAAEKAASAVGKVFAGLVDEFDLQDISDPVEKLRRLVEKGALPGVIQDLFEGLDLTTEEGIAEANKRIKELAVNTDKLTEAQRGGLSVEDFIAALRSVDAFVDDAANSITERMRQAAADIAQISSEKLRKAIKSASDRSEIRDLGPLEALGELADEFAKLSPEFEAIAAAIKAGDLEEANRLIAELFTAAGDPEKLKGLKLGELSLEEFIAAILHLEGAADSAKQAVQSLADKLTDAFDTIDLESRIFGGTPTDVLTKKLAKVLPTAQNLTTQKGRDDAIAALRALATANANDKDLLRIIADLIGQIQAIQDAVGVPGTGAPGEAPSASAVARGGGFADFAPVSAEASNRIVSLLAGILAGVNSIERYLSVFLSRTLSGPPLLPSGANGRPNTTPGGGGVATDNQVSRQINNLLAPQIQNERRLKGEITIRVD